MQSKQSIPILVALLVAPLSAADTPVLGLREIRRPVPPPKAVGPLESRHATRVIQVPDLHWAAIDGDLPEVRRLLDNGANVTATENLWGGETALHWAAISDNPSVIRELLDSGAALEVRDHDQETPVREALRSEDSNFRTLKALLVAGANADAISTNGLSALHEAVELPTEHSGEAVLLLRMFGANPTLTEEAIGATALHYAVLHPWERFAGFQLLNSEMDPNGRAADPNATDADGWTPLGWLVGLRYSNRDPRVAEWLILNGADPHKRDPQGRTPIQLATDLGYFELAAAMREAAQVASQ